MTILVTGSTGTIGSQVLAFLDGHERRDSCPDALSGNGATSFRRHCGAR